MDKNIWNPARVFDEYASGRSYKAGLGSRGLYEQNRINERFYVGDQWYGAQCGGERPLVRHNVIRRIGDYKMAVIGSNPVAVSYSAEGVPDTLDLRENTRRVRGRLAHQTGGTTPMTLTSDEEISVVMSALSDYFRVTAERVKFDDLREQVLRNAYISGTGVLYTYWDDTLATGLYADGARRTPITGDIACEVLDIENVYFGDPTRTDVQQQPYVLIAQRKSVAELKREARRRGRPAAEIDTIKPDRDTAAMAGDRADDEPEDAGKATVITKFWKAWEPGGSVRIMAAVVTRSAVIRPAWDTRLRLYPLVPFCWERRRSCAYGESEVTYLIPNQIAINRMITASVWAVMMLGMPLTVVNQDIVPQPVTNDPGQILRVSGTAEEMDSAVRYINPPDFAPAFDNNITSLISNTLTQSGANEAVLGDVRPDNASAIIAVREAATMPMKTVQNRFYSFIEDVARLWAEFWVEMYGRRSLKIEDESGTWYLPFDGSKYRDLLISVRVDVGASNLWSEIESIKTLDNLLERGVITPVQYLRRLPKGTVPEIGELIRELRAAGGTADDGENAAPAPSFREQVLAQLPAAYRRAFDAAEPEKQAQLLHLIGVTEEEESAAQ